MHVHSHIYNQTYMQRYICIPQCTLAIGSEIQHDFNYNYMPFLFNYMPLPFLILIIIICHCLLIICHCPSPLFILPSHSSLSPYTPSSHRPLWYRSSVLLHLPALADVPQSHPFPSVDVICHHTTSSMALLSGRAISLSKCFCPSTYLCPPRCQCTIGSSFLPKEWDGVQCNDVWHSKVYICQLWMLSRWLCSPRGRHCGRSCTGMQCCKCHFGYRVGSLSWSPACFEHWRVHPLVYLWWGLLQQHRTVHWHLHQCHYWSCKLLHQWGD